MLTVGSTGGWAQESAERPPQPANTSIWATHTPAGASRAAAAAPLTAAAAAARRGFAVERGPSQTDSAEGVKQPFAEGDSQASKRQIK